MGESWGEVVAGDGNSLLVLLVGICSLYCYDIREEELLIGKAICEEMEFLN